MQFVPSTQFVMGSAVNADTPSDESTPDGATNLVAVDAFCIDRTEVTVKAYAQCTSCAAPKHTVEFEGLTPKGRAVESQFCNQGSAADHPINCVDWQDARAYCTAMGKRLPSESEWELAARGAAGSTYPWGNAEPSAERLNACGSECAMLTIGKPLVAVMGGHNDTAPATAPVGSYAAGATPSGLLDLAGNVWEWTESRYCPYPFRSVAECGDSRRVLRGGGWDTTESTDFRSTRRYPAAPTARGKSVGFRCAMDP
jgi:formylglycine-generating enzyme required for sulfatase activity